MKLNKNFRIYLGLFMILLIGIVVYNRSISINEPTIKNNIPQVCINKTCFDSEIADTPAEREYGLMNRTFMPELSGMLFVFEQSGQYNFWMKNTLIPLDMIRIDDQNKIVDIKEATPCTQDPCMIYTPQGFASYVLELNIGISQKYGFKVGDTVKIKK